MFSSFCCTFCFGGDLNYTGNHVVNIFVDEMAIAVNEVMLKLCRKKTCKQFSGHVALQGNCRARDVAQDQRRKKGETEYNSHFIGVLL